MGDRRITQGRRLVALVAVGALAAACSGSAGSTASEEEPSGAVASDGAVSSRPIRGHFQSVEVLSCEIDYDGLVELQAKVFEAELGEEDTDACMALATVNSYAPEGAMHDLRYATATTSALALDEIASRHGRSSPVGPTYGEVDIGMVIVRAPEPMLCCSRGIAAEDTLYDTVIRWYSRTEGVRGTATSLTSSGDPMTNELVALAVPPD